MLPERECLDTTKRLSQRKQRLGHSWFSSSLQGYILSLLAGRQDVQGPGIFLKPCCEWVGYVEE